MIQADINLSDRILPNLTPFAEQLGEPALQYGPNLHFRTTRVCLAVGKIYPSSLETRAGCVVAEFVDHTRRAIGAMLPNIFYEHEIQNGELCELIAISWGKIREDPSEEFPTHFLIYADWALRAWYRNVDVEPTEANWFEFYNVLWIEWKDGIAYRKALGRVIKPAWERLDLDMIDVTLG